MLKGVVENLTSPLIILETAVIFMSIFKKKEQTERVLPEHIAIIMDGNGRWAKNR